MDIRLKINIVSDLGEPFMGSGPLKLLENIVKYRSTNGAAKKMNLSYVKALKMLNRLEKNVGEDFLTRKRGGNQRGGTQLTCHGKRYIREYDRLEKRLRRHAQREFGSFMKRLKERKVHG
jgi:molybdate transport repressor ModE-like protein